MSRQLNYQDICKIVTRFEHHCSYSYIRLTRFRLRALTPFMIWVPDNVDGFPHYVLAYLSSNANAPWQDNKTSGIHVTMITQFKFGNLVVIGAICIIWVSFEHGMSKSVRAFVNGVKKCGHDIHASNILTHWGRDQIDAISQTTFSNAFSRMKMNEFLQGFHWSLFLRFELTIFEHWFR